MAKKIQKKGKLQQALVLFHYILQLFGCKDLEALSRDLKDPAYEGLNDDHESKLYHELCHKLYATGPLSIEQLYFYDQHIVKFTDEINEKRSEPIKWKYFQYLSLLFTEIYLDQYFSNPQALCDNLNRFLHDDFNHRAETWHELPDFTVDDLNKLAYWNATGSGKTLLMHVNIKQYQEYARIHHAKKLNRIIVLTPNEGLSRQHYEELKASNMDVAMFSKQGVGGLFQGKAVEIIDINKLADKDGDKTVAVEAFEGNNLVLVDEGHKGSSGDVWMGYRQKLTEEGFSFEYSATFGQAISAKSNAKDRKAMFDQYGKATLFDYSYRYFYADGYGKDYRIMNMNDWNDDDLLNMYLTAYLLCLYEQTKIYQSDVRIHNRFLVEKPLGIFVGSSVKAVSKENKNQVSDVTQILLFLQDFIRNRTEFSGYIRRLLSSEDGLKTKNGYSVFGNSFLALKGGYLVEDDKQKFAKNIYDAILRDLFHSNIHGAQLHIDLQKGGFEEIGLRIGSAKEYFGVINVGDGKELLKLLQDKGFLCETKAFGTSSLFNNINSQDSTVNILIGSKKFTEGWSSWRVSVMGLMNVGRSEGSEIIQLFGRGVRLKGYRYSLKRSKMLDACYQDEMIPKNLSTIETLNIFGVRADYMEAFKAYLEDEGLPTNEIDYEEIVIKTIPTVDLEATQLYLPKVVDGYNFKKSAVVAPTDTSLMNRITVKLDKYPKVDLLRSKNVQTSYNANRHIGKLTPEHLHWIDWTEVFFALQKMKAERSWYNMELRVEDFKYLMAHPSWYELAIPEANLDFEDFGKNVELWQDITISLLRGYIDQVYKKAKAREEQKHLKGTRITHYNIGTPEKYTVKIRNDQEGLIDHFDLLQELLENGSFNRDITFDACFKALSVDIHLYKPLLFLAERDANGNRPFLDEATGEPIIQISPVPLNNGERNFVAALRMCCERHLSDVLLGKQVYLLRNESKKGMGFFEANNFYPDFILWILEGEKQYLTFIDPKGIRNLKGLNDDKIQLFRYLQTSVAAQVANPNLIMNSFIISNTPMEQVEFWAKEQFAAEEFTKNHVLFEDKDGVYLNSMLEMIFLD